MAARPCAAPQAVEKQVFSSLLKPTRSPSAPGRRSPPHAGRSVTVSTIFPREVYLNGARRLGRRVSAFDRGFIFGDGCTKWSRVRRPPFRLRQHLQRLDNSLAAIGMANPLGAADWEPIFARLIAGGGDRAIYLQITRGGTARPRLSSGRRAHGVRLQPAAQYPNPGSCAPGWRRSAFRHPLGALRHQGHRAWRTCSCASDARAQRLSHSGARRVRHRGRGQQHLVVHAARLRTPARGPYILPGVTRDLILSSPAATSPATKRQ